MALVYRHIPTETFLKVLGGMEEKYKGMAPIPGQMATLMLAP